MTGIEHAVISHAVIRMNDQLTGTHWVASPLDATLHMASAQGKKGITGAVQFAVTGAENPDCHIEVKANSLPAFLISRMICNISEHPLRLRLMSVFCLRRVRIG